MFSLCANARRYSTVAFGRVMITFRRSTHRTFDDLRRNLKKKTGVASSRSSSAIPLVDESLTGKVPLGPMIYRTIRPMPDALDRGLTQAAAAGRRSRVGQTFDTRFIVQRHCRWEKKQRPSCTLFEERCIKLMMHTRVGHEAKESKREVLFYTSRSRSCRSH